MTDGYRPKPSPLPKSPPQGTRGVPGDSPPDVRSWEPVGDKRWVLCVGFGPDTYRRPMLVVDDRGAQLRWAIRQVEHVPGKGRVETWGRDVDIAEVEGELTPIEAMRWGLDELAAIARDRSLKYTRQLHLLMLERVRLGVADG